MNDDLLAAGSYETHTPLQLITGSAEIVTNTARVASGQNLAERTVVGRVAEVQATLNTGVIANNNAIRWAAVNRGTAGNTVTVALVDPAANNAALGVVVVGQAVTVNLATGAAGAITSTAAQVIAAVAASAPAAALVVGTNQTGSSGAAAVVAAAAAPLASGANNGQVKALNITATDGTATPVGFLVHGVDASGGETDGQLYVAGVFNPDALVWPSTVQTDSQKHALFVGSGIELRRPT
jgi:hypothetical protein